MYNNINCYFFYFTPWLVTAPQSKNNAVPYKTNYFCDWSWGLGYPHYNQSLSVIQYFWLIIY